MGKRDKHIVSFGVDKGIIDEFKNKCDDLGKPYQVMIRALIEKFNSGDLKINLTDKEKKSLKVYAGLI